jgi:hypothetical protein
MALTGTQLIMIMEGVVGNVIGGGVLNYPQAIPFWLRATKEAINFNARHIDDDFVLDIEADAIPDETVLTAATAESYLIAALGKSVETAACLITIHNDDSVTPPGDSITTMLQLYMPAAAATTPIVVGAVFFPFQTVAASMSINGAKAVDGTTTPGTAGELKAWVISRDV